jgi:hypothetical protein
MALRNLGWFISCVLITLKLYSQVKISNIDSVFLKVYNSEMNQCKINKKNILFISNANCIGCVNYFTKLYCNYQYLILLKDLSISDGRKLIDLYKLQRKNVLFTSINNINFLKTELVNKPSPILLEIKKDYVNYYDYDNLISITNDFSLNRKELRKELKVKDNQNNK